MERKVKKQYKKYRKNYRIAAWCLIGMLILLFLILFNTVNQLSKLWIGIIIGGIYVSVILGLIFTHLSQHYYKFLVDYKNNIREYRIRRNFIFAYDLLNSGDIKAAIDYYRLIPNDHLLSNHLYIAITHECKYSDDLELNNKWIDIIDNVRQVYHPAKIIF